MRRGRRAEHDDERRAELQWELSEVQEAISRHRAESSRIYEAYDQRQIELEAERDAALAALEPGSSDYASESADWKQIIGAIRAERVSVANERTAELDDLRKRQSEIEAILGVSW